MAAKLDPAMGAAGGINPHAKLPTPYQNHSNQPDEYAILIPPTPSVEANAISNGSLPEIAQFSPSKPPKIPGDFETAPASPRRRSVKAKPKSRFGEASANIDSYNLESYGTPRGEFDPNFPPSPSRIGSPALNSRASSLARRTPKGSSGRKEDVNDGPDEREVYRRVTAQLKAQSQLKTNAKFFGQFVVFILILSCLVASFTVKKMEGAVFFGLKLWKWFVLLMSIFSGMLITRWIVHLVVFFIEWKFILKKNVVYFTHGLKGSVEVFIWILVVLATWVLVFKPDVVQSRRVLKFLDFVTWTIASLLIGSFLWLIKTTLLKLLASSFHLNRFFNRIQDSVFHHYVLQILSGRPVMESFQQKCETEIETEDVKSKKVKKKIDMGKLHQMKKDKVPSYTMQLLVDVVSNSGLSTMSGMLEEDHVEGGVELDDDEISSEEHAITTAVGIFENIVQYKDNRQYMFRNDLLRFLMEEEVDIIYPLLEPDEKGRISIKAFSTWVVKVFKDRLQLQHALNDSKTAVNQLNKIVIAILMVIVFVLWLLLTELASTKLLLFFSSQLVVAAFVFGNTCKTIFEAIIFVFVMHPFDVGDRCLVEGTMYVVEEMNILTTVFLKPDKEKVYFPNSVLATKPISNYFRSPENQGDTLEFSIDFMTPLAKIGELKERIKKYLVSNPNHWHPDHNVVVKEIENVNKIKIALYPNHTMNFQDMPEKNRRRSELVLELKRIFEEIGIRYNLPPQEVIMNGLPPVTNATSR